MTSLVLSCFLIPTSCLALVLMLVIILMLTPYNGIMQPRLPTILPILLLILFIFMLTALYPSLSFSFFLSCLLLSFASSCVSPEIHTLPYTGDNPSPPPNGASLRPATIFLPFLIPFAGSPRGREPPHNLSMGLLRRSRYLSTLLHPNGLSADADADADKEKDRDKNATASVLLKQNPVPRLAGWVCSNFVT